MAFLKVLRMRHLAVLWLSQVLSAMGDYLLGKVFSLRMLLASAGGSLGLLFAVPLFALLSVPVAITLCALAMSAIGVAGLVCFGFTEPIVTLGTQEAERVS